jgi:ribonuclease HII
MARIRYATRFPRPGGLAPSRHSLLPGNYIGVDEAGRGCLAGPMVICAAAIKPGVVDGVRDSKTLPRERIPLIARELEKNVVAYKLAVMSAKYIDEKGINAAWDVGTSAVIEEIQKECDWPVVVDGDRLPSKGQNITAFPKADASVYQVSAAGIIAKAKQLEAIAEYNYRYPKYEFSSHAGYGTKRHLELLKEYGPSPVHRMSFRPVSADLDRKEGMKFSPMAARQMIGDIHRAQDGRESMWEQTFVTTLSSKLESGKVLGPRDMLLLRMIHRKKSGIIEK